MVKLVLILALVVLAGCNSPALVAAPTPAPAQTPTPVLTCKQQANQAFGAQAKEWADAYLLASATPRASLPARIADLQRINRATSQLAPNVPACASVAFGYLLEWQMAAIDAYTEFLQYGQSTLLGNVQGKTEQARVLQQHFIAEEGALPG